jgi:hypothetical protein
MIKINLLPPHVVERRKVRSLAILLLAVLLLEIGGFFFYYSTLVQTEKKKQAELKKVTADAQNVLNLDAAAQAEIAAAGSAQTNLTWYDGNNQHNAKIADSLSKINEYIYAKMTIRSLNLNGAQVSIQGSTKNLDHIAAAYLNLLRCPYITPPRGVTFTPSLGNTAAPSGGPQRSTAEGRDSRISGRPSGQTRQTGVVQASAPAVTSGNPNEQDGVAFGFTLKPEYSIATAKSSSPQSTTSPQAGGMGRGYAKNEEAGRGRGK